MWSLRQRNDGSFYLTFDKARMRSYHERGVWERICGVNDLNKNTYVAWNQYTGHLVCEDDEGGVRVLILED